MSWPLQSDFASMLKNPSVGFRDAELRQCSVEMNQLGQPKARSGNFAAVYRGFRPDGTEFAIRVFNRRQDERLQHYRAISDYLQGRAISSIVRFEYDEQGIRSAGDGKLYPLLLMEWVSGTTIFDWLRKQCKKAQPGTLLAGAEMWQHLVRELSEHGVVHGDLQHGNVMVSPSGQLKLVDYDCMAVPALLGRRNLETGLPPYQHPGRNGETVLFPGLDNFSALLIYVALRALAAAPKLWQTHVAQPGYDRIMFRDEDFREPLKSPLYQDLLQSPDGQVRELTHCLFELWRHDLRKVPRLDEVLSGFQAKKTPSTTQKPLSFRTTAFPLPPVPGEKAAPVGPSVVWSCRQPSREAIANRSAHPAAERPGRSKTSGAETERQSSPAPLQPPPLIPPNRSGSPRPPTGSNRGWVWWFVGSALISVLLGIAATLLLLIWRTS